MLDAHLPRGKTAIHRVVRMLGGDESARGSCGSTKADAVMWCGIDRRLHLLRRLVASSCLSCVVAALAASHNVVQRDITSWRLSIPLDNTFWPCKETSSQGKTAYLIAETPKRPCHGQLWIFLHALIAALQPRASVLHEADNC